MNPAIEKARGNLLKGLFLEGLDKEVAKAIAPLVSLDYEAKILRVECLSFTHAMDTHALSYAALLRCVGSNPSLLSLARSVRYEYSYGDRGFLFPLLYKSPHQGKSMEVGEGIAIADDSGGLLYPYFDELEITRILWQHEASTGFPASFVLESGHRPYIASNDIQASCGISKAQLIGGLGAIDNSKYFPLDELEKYLEVAARSAGQFIRVQYKAQNISNLVLCDREVELMRVRSPVGLGRIVKCLRLPRELA
jgi:hypothetical protein